MTDTPTPASGVPVADPASHGTADDIATAARLRVLGQPVRLMLYRVLVRAGMAGLAAGEVQARLGLAPSTLSYHLKAMEAAGLVRRRRAGNTILCLADFAVMRGLVDRLAAECCADDDTGDGA
ncbi:MAG: ArsR/SmtB family transcription factor [Gemmobacter sp.]